MNMSKLLYTFKGVRGRNMEVFDRKVVISTDVTVGSVLTRNATDGIKTIFFTDVVGIQFKQSGLTIGYIQFETSSTQMNNQGSNQFSENTFTFEQGKNGVTNEKMVEVYNLLCDLIEDIKFSDYDNLKSRSLSFSDELPEL